jgi:hypothetical protein
MPYSLNAVKKSARKYYDKTNPHNAFVALGQFCDKFIGDNGPGDSEINFKFNMETYEMVVKLCTDNKVSDNTKEEMLSDFGVYIEYMLKNYIANHFGKGWVQHYGNETLPDAEFMLKIKSLDTKTIEGAFIFRLNGFQN